MAVNMKGKSVVSIHDLTREEVNQILIQPIFSK